MKTGNISLYYIFGMPLFWEFFAIFGGICALYHGFCKCVRQDFLSKMKFIFILTTPKLNDNNGFANKDELIAGD